MQVVRGHGRLVGEREVRVEGPDGGERTLVRATRAGRDRHRLPGRHPRARCALLQPWTSRDATGVQDVPDELLIVGGGVVAVEAATWMAALGSQVTLLVRGAGLLTGFEPFAGEHVLEALRGLGVDGAVRRLGALRRAHRRPRRRAGPGLHGGRVSLQLQDAQGDREIGGDEVLVATGRTPRLSDVGLDALGLSADDVIEAEHPATGGSAGADSAGDSSESTALPSWLHAVGDASGDAPLTHWGKYRARVIGQAIRAGATDGRLEPVPEIVPVPQVVFSDPQVTSVGLTEKAARDAGHDVVTAQVPFGGAAGFLPAAGRRHRHRPAGRRPEDGDSRRCHLRGPGGLRADPRGDHRDRRSGAGARAAPRGAELPHELRAMAAAARGTAPGAARRLTLPSLLHSPPCPVLLGQPSASPHPLEGDDRSHWCRRPLVRCNGC